ncbi:hypothetical protein [Teredinibacter turnerae]|uniref:hypothetical protein n=1 Tax=Teredinibacter turnerae TaxID=2426 RepID=UPI0030CCA0D7
MKKFILLLFLFATGCTSTPSKVHQERARYSQESILLNSYLGNEHPAYTHNGSNDELAQFKLLERFYIQLVEPINGVYTRDNLALIFFFSLYAVHKNNAAFNEYLSSDLKIIAYSEPELFAATLSELDFSISAVCSRLGDESENSDGAEPRREVLENIIVKIFKKTLSEQEFNACNTAFYTK